MTIQLNEPQRRLGIRARNRFLAPFSIAQHAGSVALEGHAPMSKIAEAASTILECQ